MTMICNSWISEVMYGREDSRYNLWEERPVVLAPRPAIELRVRRYKMSIICYLQLFYVATLTFATISFPKVIVSGYNYRYLVEDAHEVHECQSVTLLSRNGLHLWLHLLKEGVQIMQYYGHLHTHSGQGFGETSSHFIAKMAWSVLG